MAVRNGGGYGYIADHCSARLDITLTREVKSYLLENYLPSTLFVCISWGSFVVVPEIVPGRMVLLVTTLLSLVTMFDTVRNNSPDALELKCIEVGALAPQALPPSYPSNVKPLPI